MISFLPLLKLKIISVNKGKCPLGKFPTILKSELKFIKKLLENPSKLKSSHIKGINIIFYEALIQIVLTEKG